MGKRDLRSTAGSAPRYPTLRQLSRRALLAGLGAILGAGALSACFPGRSEGEPAMPEVQDAGDALAGEPELPDAGALDGGSPDSGVPDAGQPTAGEPEQP
jgi:hypothetical protein